MNDSKTGSQRPALLREPDEATDWSWSDVAVEWAEHVGYVLDDWQRWLVRWTFARRSDGLWAARDVGVEVGRQNGKNIWIEVVELASLLLFGDRLIRHTAHLVDTSTEHFISMKERIEATPELMEYMPKQANNGFIKSHGFESIEFDNGARLQFKARQSSSGRGPRPQKVIFDEALVLDPTRIGSMAPGISAQRNPQILFASSPPKADSVSLHQLRNRALEPMDGDRLFYAGWTNPPDTDLDDPEAWYRANPSLGYGRLTVTALQANRRLLDPSEFLREHVGVAESPLTDDDRRAIDAGTWDALAQVSTIESHRQWAVACSNDLKWASIGVAGRRADGLYHVEWMEHRAGTGWLVERIVEGWEAKRIPIRIHSGGAEKFLIAKLREQGVAVDEVSTSDYAAATGDFITAAYERQLRHLGQPSLDKALAGAVLKISETGSSVWSEKSSSVEISPLKAVTVALGGVPTDAEWSGSFTDLQDLLTDDMEEETLDALSPR